MMKLKVGSQYEVCQQINSIWNDESVIVGDRIVYDGLFSMLDDGHYVYAHQFYCVRTGKLIRINTQDAGLSSLEEMKV